MVVSMCRTCQAVRQEWGEGGGGGGELSTFKFLSISLGEKCDLIEIK